MSNLTTNPWADIQNGRKILRSRTGKNLTLISKPVRVFWTYDDMGENDMALEIYAVHKNGFSARWNMRERQEQGEIKKLNASGSYHLYTCPSLDWYVNFYGYLTLETFMRDTDRTRRMTFWVFGMKIHVTASNQEVSESENFIAKTEILSGRRVYVNDVYRGIWPPNG